MFVCCCCLFCLFRFFYFIPNYKRLFHQKHNRTQLETWMTSKRVSVTTFQYLVSPPLLSVTAWMRCGVLDTRVSLYSWLISLTQTFLIVCLMFSALDGCLYSTLIYFLYNSLQVLDWIEIWTVHRPFQDTYLVFLQELSGYLWSVTRSAILYDGRAAVDVHVQFHLLV